MCRSESSKPRLKVAAAIFIIVVSNPTGPVKACVYEEPTVWEAIERMTADQLAGTMILFGLLALLAYLSLSQWRAIVKAVSQTRCYESRVLTALFYDRVEEAVNVCALFPSSPVAAVVTASVQQSRTLPGSESGSLTMSKPAFQRAVVAQTIALKKRLWILDAIAWSSPVIGLATAMLPSTHYGGGPPIAFCFGLLIAAPALWLHRGLASEVELLLVETDRMSLSIIDQLGAQVRAPIDKRTDPGA